MRYVNNRFPRICRIWWRMNCMRRCRIPGHNSQFYYMACSKTDYVVGRYPKPSKYNCGTCPTCCPTKPTYQDQFQAQSACKQHTTVAWCNIGETDKPQPMRYNEAGSCVVYEHIIRICIICVLYWIVCMYAYGSCLHTSTHVQCRHVNRSIELWRQCYKCLKRLKMHTQVPMHVVGHGCMHAECCVYACVYMNVGCGDPITR